MLDESTRKCVINYINSSARKIFDEKKYHLSAYISYAYDEKELIYVAKQVEMKPEEADTCMQIIYQDNSGEFVKLEDDRLIERANELIEASYEYGKYEGRDVSGLLSLLFHRINPELGAKFEASQL